MSDSVRPHRWQPTRLPHPWDSPGKNTAVGCHFLLQCMKVKSESEVAQSCPTLRDPMDCSLPGSSVHGIFQARVLEWGAIAFSRHEQGPAQISKTAAAAASVIWTAEPVPGLSVRGRSLCPTSLPEGVVCAPSLPEGVIFSLSTGGRGLCSFPPEGVVCALLYQRAWSVPSPSEGVVCAPLH